MPNRPVSALSCPVLSQIGEKEVNVRTYTAAFNLRGAAQEKLVGSMSGGERNRVHLAKVTRREWMVRHQPLYCITPPTIVAVAVTVL